LSVRKKATCFDRRRSRGPKMIDDRASCGRP